jgi:hypothetical protein
VAPRAQDDVRSKYAREEGNYYAKENKRLSDKKNLPGASERKSVFVNFSDTG